MDFVSLFMCLHGYNLYTHFVLCLQYNTETMEFIYFISVYCFYRHNIKIENKTFKMYFHFRLIT